jgi:catechol 2,3-dioxygenase-like lactoylglutathione lyase family enzyme
MSKLVLDHIAINVEDISIAAEWYRKELGARLEYTDTTWGMLDINGSKLALTVQSQHKPHVAFRVQSLAELGPEYHEHRDGSCYIYKVDPDGNTVELIYWRSDGNAKAT